MPIRPAAVLLLLACLAAPAGAVPITFSQTGRIALVEGPEPVGGVAVGDPFTLEITYDSDDVTGIGEETLLFDGVYLVGPTFRLDVGTETYTELDTANVTTITFRNGFLVGYNYRLAEWNPPSGARYFVFAEDGVLSQSVSFLPFGVDESRVEGLAPIPEPASALGVGLGLALLAVRRRPPRGP